MRLKLTLQRASGGSVDLVTDVDGSVTVGAMALAVARSEPSGSLRALASDGRPTLSVAEAAGRWRPLDPGLALAESDLGSGQHVQVVAAARQVGGSGATLTVLAGPDAGQTFELVHGVNSVGRDRSARVRLTDPMVSQRHAKVVVGDTIEIVDDSSTNGILIGADQVQRVVLRNGDQAVLGDSVIAVSVRETGRAGSPVAASGTVAFNRSPRVDPAYEGAELIAPDPPTPQQPQRFPLITALVPLLMGGVLFAITRSVFSIVFVALSPMMVVGSYWENRRAARRSLEEGSRLFRQNLAQLVAELGQEQERERRGRGAEHPSTAEMVEAVRDLSPLLWTRRPEHASFLALRMGLGRQSSRTTVEVSGQRNAPVELQHELKETVEPYLHVDEVPIVVRLDESGSLGISGPDELRGDIARSIVAQLVALHSPAEVVLCGLASPRSAPAWDWLKWLPHVGGDHSPLTSAPLATTAPTCGSLALELADLVATRAETADPRKDGPALPAVVVVVEDDAPIDRAALVRIMETGREHGVHVIWVAPTTARVPAAARTFLEVDLALGAATGKVIEGERVTSVVVEPLATDGAEWLARRLSPVVDAGIQADTASDVPTAVSFVREAGLDLVDDAAAVVERWRESSSLRSPGAPRRLKRDNTLRALVGRSALDPLHLDLRTQGPHALVGGTTGAGKSEFLQTWILAMAAAHSPQRLTFLFVDYKGGSAFADCTQLPHSVGLVTDLTPHLVQRALVSLNAELRHREEILNKRKAKDLLELERRGDPEAPPSLVIVVDEFAALVQEVPEFVDGMVNVAQRGRSLGLHLILATQRPAGVIKDNLRANTNLRIALRMADEEDSKDVVGTPLAGTFDPGVPGRGIAKTGPGRLTLFQSGYVGGWTSNVPDPPTVRLSTLVFGSALEWEADEEEAPAVAPEVDLGPTDIQRLVANLGDAATLAGVDAPRRPWLPDLAHVYDLSALPNARRDAELVYGVVDLPESQSQEEVAFEPDEVGNMAVFGTGGSGKTTFLRTLAVSAGFTARSGPCFVYGLDFGSRGLKVLEHLPHVGSIIGADDAERTIRLMSHLRATVDERAVQFAAVNAGSVEEYRRLAEQPGTPRILLLVDGFAAFRTAYEPAIANRVFEQLIGIAADGRPVGVHVVISADRLGAVPATLASAIQRKLALRTASELDDDLLGVPKGGFATGSPPGRGFVGGAAIQVAVLGGTTDVAAQAREVERLAASMARAGAIVAPPVERLPELVGLEDLPASIDGLPVFGVADDTLGPAGFEPTGTFLVAGPAGSGRSTVIRTMIASLRRSRPSIGVAYFGPRRSPLAGDVWEHTAIGPAEAAKQAAALAEEWADSEGDGRVVVIDGLGDMLNTDADYPLQDLLKVCRSTGVFVIADGETSDVTGSWPLVSAIKSARHGIILQPDPGDGDTIFRTGFGRINRVDFPEGRGIYVRQGRTRRIQVAQVHGDTGPPSEHRSP